MRAPRVVITGLGTINSLGNSVSEFWDGLVKGKSGIGRITRFDASELPCRIAGEIRISILGNIWIEKLFAGCLALCCWQLGLRIRRSRTLYYL